MADRIRLLNRPLPETPKHEGHFPDNSSSGQQHYPKTPVHGHRSKENRISLFDQQPAASSDEQDNLFNGNLWKAYLYELQLKAPTPKRVVASRAITNRPPHYGREFHGVLSREEAERILINYTSSNSPSNTNKTSNSSGTASSDGSFDRWHHGHGHGTGSSGGQNTNRSDGGQDPDTGRYLVRESDRTPGQYTLSLRFNKVTKNFKLFYDGHKHFVGEKRFDTVHDLVADSLITLYLELHAADYIASLGNQQRYEESPYMTLHRRHRAVKLKKGYHRNHKTKDNKSIVSSPGHFQLTQHQVVHPQAVKASGGHRLLDSRVGQVVTPDLPADFNINKRHGKMEAIRLPNDTIDDEESGDFIDGLIRKNLENGSKVVGAKNGGAMIVKLPAEEGKKKMSGDKQQKSSDQKKEKSSSDKQKMKKNSEKDDGTERSSSVLGACEDLCPADSDSEESGALVKNGAFIGEQQKINVQLFEKVHNFKTHNFIGLPFCDFCANFMWGIIGQGVKCEDCGFQAHRKCSEKVPADCCPDLRHIKRVFGIDLTTLVKACNTIIPFVVESCVKEIEYRGLHVEGLYRVSGFADDVEALKLRLECSEETSGRSPEESVLEDFTADQILRSCDDVHVITGVLKLYFRLLPIPLITFDTYPHFLAAIKKPDEGEKLKGIKDSVNKLPPAHYQTLKFFIAHLVRVASYEDQNLMTAHNLSTVFCPTLMKTPNICLAPFSVNVWQYESDVIEFLINHHSILFK